MPSPEEIRAVVRRYATLLCDSDANALAELFAGECSVEDPVGSAPIRGKEAVRAFYAAASPHVRVQIVGPICVAPAQCAVPLLGVISANDRKSYVDVIDAFTFDEAGKITSMRAFWTPAEMRSAP
jgi:steroid delta-isomerase